MRWYKGQCVLEALDEFRKAAPKDEQPFRFPVQDIYKFTEEADERRIVAGRVETGAIKVGDEVVFFPSGKSSKVASVESFATPVLSEAFAGQAAGFTLETQIYIKPGEIMVKRNEKKPHVATKFKANIFWMGRTPLVKGKTYKLKLATAQVPVLMREIIGVLDASELSSITNKPQVDRHDVAECVFETLKPVSFDEIASIAETGRFVIVDNYEISGGGIVLAPVFEEGSALSAYIKEREFRWERSDITASKRSKSYKHKSLFVVITGEANMGKIALAKRIERELFEKGKNAYFLGITNEALTSSITSTDKTLSRIQYIRQIGELAHVMTDAGLILISSISDIDEHDLKTLKSLNHPNRTLVIHVGETPASSQQTDLLIKPGAPPEEAFRSIVALIENASTLDPEFTI
jgi:bifunctional enzyme CysN/CysC